MKVVSPSREWTELEQFAHCFHQEWGNCFSDIREFGHMYVTGLPSDRRVVLRQELLQFLKRRADEPPGALWRLWMKRGAQGWPRDVDVRTTLKSFAEAMKDDE